MKERKLTLSERIRFTGRVHVIDEDNGVCMEEGEIAIVRPSTGMRLKMLIHDDVGSEWINRNRLLTPKSWSPLRYYPVKSNPEWAALNLHLLKLALGLCAGRWVMRGFFGYYILRPDVVDVFGKKYDYQACLPCWKGWVAASLAYGEATTPKAKWPPKGLAGIEPSNYG